MNRTRKTELNYAKENIFKVLSINGCASSQIMQSARGLNDERPLFE